jgi:hypothetical protein
MPKAESAATLLKRLQKIERAQGRLGEITTRIRVQAETLAELLKVAQAFVNEKPKRAPTRTVARAAAKTPTTPRARPAKTAARGPAKKSTTARVRGGKAATTRRRAPRRAVSA